MVDVDTAAIVITAVAAIVVPLAFVGLVVIAAIAVRRGAVLGPVALRGIAFAGGLALGAMLVVAGEDLTLDLPFIGIGAAIAVNEWRLGRRASAGWLVVGLALPWTLLWGAYALALVASTHRDAGDAVRRFAIGALPLAIGLIVAGQAAGEASGPQAARARGFGVVARAIREPSRIGPFRLPELAAVIAWAAVGLGIAFLPIGDAAVRFVVATVVGSALASEAYLRAMAPASRAAMEAFSWLGEQGLAELRGLRAGRVPTAPGAARAWLRRHPAVPDEPAAMRSLRIEALLLAGQVDEARRAATDQPAGDTPEARYVQAADRQLLAWWTASPDAANGITALQDAATAIGPIDGDARLRAEVSVAAAQVRDRATQLDASPIEVLAPLVAVRARLGARADGLLRRVLWRRLFAAFVAVSVVLELVGLATGLAGPV